ncbi:MAG: 3'-5' exonuclease [Chloroflexi bacterium]|nr:3'-5' exonuclease [Chloroflexota bacterium]
MADEVWISVDVETSGPTPSSGSLIAIGACRVDDPEEGFSVEIRPQPDRPWSADAEAIHGLTRERLAATGIEPDEALLALEAWLGLTCGEGQPIFVAFNAPFDWMFVADYAWRYLGRNPFGHTALDIKALYLGRHLAEVRRWGDTGRLAILERYPVDRPHTHNALDDAREQAAILVRLLESVGR